VSHITCDGTSSKLCEKRIDELMDKGIQTLDQKQRDQYYQEVWAMLNKNPHAIYLLQQNLIYGLAKRLDWQPRLDDEVRVAAMRAGQ
jgi:ABC-type transport system substrate-binding protein